MATCSIRVIGHDGRCKHGHANQEGNHGGGATTIYSPVARVSSTILRARSNVQLGRFGRNRSNVWRYPGANSFARCGGEGNLSALHPTVKPVAMIADAILDCSARGDIVLDGFVGSGTTVIAAERTGRRCYGLELDPAYVDTIVRRWQALTGGSARHSASGRSFDDLACEAEAGDAD